MEGPTPVSALIHAATMVAAGVYMVARLAPLFGPEAMLVILYVGAITAFITATIALVKTDFKRVLAFSTLSQLGYMVMSLGAGDSINAMFHLTTHAMFKGLLFLCAGSVIHAVHSQEITDMGGLRKKMPITFLTYMAGTMALAGVPFFAGFYSKDGILGSTLAFGMTDGHYLPFILGILAALLTPFYMFRLTFLAFFGKPADQERYDHAHESPLNMTIPLMILGVLSICAAGWQTADKGWFSKFAAPYDVPAIAAGFHMEGAAGAHELVVADHGDVHHEPAGHGEAAAHDTHTAEAGQGAAAHGDHGGHHDVHHTAHIRAMIMSIIMVILGITGAWWVYHRKKVDTAALQVRLSGGYKVLQGQYFFDEFYAATVYRATLWWAAVCAGFDRIVIDGIVNGSGYLTRMVSWISGAIDRYFVDGIVNGIASVLHGIGEGFRRIQTGRIQTYLAYVSASVLVLVLFYNVLQ
jgi:NADH-quinone oxidoreductase subunit L